MILSPAILGLLCCSALVGAVAALAAAVGLSVMFGWDPEDSSDRQLARERRSFLVEAALRVVLGCQLLSLFLFIATADRLHPLFTGAMCAAGTLNASRFGYPTLLVKMAAFLLCGLWLVVSRASLTAGSTGLVRFKQASALCIVGALLAENVLQYRYFSDLNPEILTSCCATLFNEDAAGLGANLAALPVRESRVTFFAALALTFGTGLRSLRNTRSPALFSVFAVLLGIVSVAAVITWIAPGFYELPTHHCPFCLLSSEYGYVGYPLYGLLSLGVVAGGGAGLVHTLRAIDPLDSIGPGEERRWCVTSMAAFVLFFLIAVWPMLASDFRMEGY